MVCVPDCGCRTGRCRCARASPLRAIADSKSPLMPIDSASRLKPRAFSSSSNPRSRANSARSAAWFSCGGGTHIRPRNLMRGSSAVPAARSGEPFRCDPSLGGFGDQRDLDAQIERRRVEGPLLRQAPGYAEAVDAVHPFEVLGYGAGLVRLQAPDEMPVQRQIAEHSLLRKRLLQIIFPEIRDARRCGVAHQFGRLGLRHGYQGHRRRGRARRSRPPDVSEIGRGSHETLNSADQLTYWVVTPSYILAAADPSCI